MSKTNLILPLTVTAIGLLIPWIAMNYTSQLMWNHSDFVIAGILLFVTGMIIQFLAVFIKNRTTRIVAILALLGLALLLWAELAVGVFGSPLSGS